MVSFSVLFATINPVPGARTIGKLTVLKGAMFVPTAAIAITRSFPKAALAPLDMLTESRADSPPVGMIGLFQRVSVATAPENEAPRIVVVRAIFALVPVGLLATTPVTATMRPLPPGLNAWTNENCAATAAGVFGVDCQRTSSFRKLHSGRSSSRMKPAGA